MLYVVSRENQQDERPRLVINCVRSNWLLKPTEAWVPEEMTGHFRMKVCRVNDQMFLVPRDLHYNQLLKIAPDLNADIQQIHEAVDELVPVVRDLIRNHTLKLRKRGNRLGNLNKILQEEFIQALV